jgi:hypothetical protein
VSTKGKRRKPTMKNTKSKKKQRQEKELNEEDI